VKILATSLWSKKTLRREHTWRCCGTLPVDGDSWRETFRGRRLGEDEKGVADQLQASGRFI